MPLNKNFLDREPFGRWLAYTLGGIVAVLVAASEEPFAKALLEGVLTGAATGAAFYFLLWVTLWRRRR